ncbi:unnamed protein product [Calypogeia fissa]
MSPDLEPQKNAGQQQQVVVAKHQQEIVSSAVTTEKAAAEEEVTASVAIVETSTRQENGGSSGFDRTNKTGKETVAILAAAATTSTAPVNIEAMDEELLQEQAQAVVEELQKRGACTTLALAKMLGMEKSTQLNPLLYLLLEKNVVARVTDFPPIWSLSPTFPVSSLSSTAPAAPAAPAVVHAVPRSCSPAPSASPPAYTSVQPARIMAQQPQAVPRHSSSGTIITFPPIPADRATKPIITFPPIPSEPQALSEPVSLPAASGTLQPADYWQSLSQTSSGKNNRNGGGPPFKKWKKQKNLSELQLRLLKELKERGPTRTLELSKLVGLVTTRDVNPSIYDLKQRNLVVKVNNAPPVWQLNEPGMSKAQFISGMEVEEDEDQSEREIHPGTAFGGLPIAVNSQGLSSLSFFH